MLVRSVEIDQTQAVVAPKQIGSLQVAMADSGRGQTAK
jgi:hypothetical protein